MSDARTFPEHSDDYVPREDPIQKWLVVAIVFVIILALTGVLYVVLGGSLTNSTPRTLAESKLVTLENAATNNPGSGPARRDYIVALFATGQTDAAEAQYKKALSQTSGHERTAVYDAGVLLRFYSEDYKGAVGLAKTALAADDAAREKKVAALEASGTQLGVDALPSPYRISILITSARASGALKQWKDAEKSLTQALKYDPQAADILVLRAGVYEQMDAPSKAIADYQEALRFIPDHQPAVEGLKRLKAK